MEKKENVTDVELPTTCNWVTFYCSCPSRPLSGRGTSSLHRDEHNPVGISPECGIQSVWMKAYDRMCRHKGPFQDGETPRVFLCTCSRNRWGAAPGRRAIMCLVLPLRARAGWQAADEASERESLPQHAPAPLGILPLGPTVPRRGSNDNCQTGAS